MTPNPILVRAAHVDPMVALSGEEPRPATLINTKLLHDGLFWHWRNRRGMQARQDSHKRRLQINACTVRIGYRSGRRAMLGGQELPHRCCISTGGFTSGA